jgi:hypothetical protein
MRVDFLPTFGEPRAVELLEKCDTDLFKISARAEISRIFGLPINNLKILHCEKNTRNIWVTCQQPQNKKTLDRKRRCTS